MIDKPKIKKQLTNQDKQLPNTIQELINRYDLDNEDVYSFLDYLVESINESQYYKKGDTETTRFVGGGILTGNQTEIRFTIYLPKRMDNVDVTVSDMILYIRRPTGGYIFQGTHSSVINGTVQIVKDKNALMIRLILNDRLTDEVNNIPLGIQATDIILNFS